ncbi:MAG: hypothetical protein AMS25_04070 [Gemmatimonas sp. SM23_52]|nr:MAG: hypothetical protein AMS25_04070 [Gemmatimonas sp. SM23_52]
MSEPLNEPSPSADERQRRAVRRWSVRLAVLVVLAGVVLALWHPWRRRDPLAAFADIRFIDSVAVLSIENRTGEPAMAHLCAGITDEIVGRLKRVGLIKVSDPYSVEQLVALELTAGQLADSLGVEKLVVGSLYATADGVRLNMRVSNGATGELLSTRRYDWNADTRLETAPNLAQAFVDDYVDAIPLTAVPARPPPTTHSPGHEAYLIAHAPPSARRWRWTRPTPTPTPGSRTSTRSRSPTATGSGSTGTVRPPWRWLRRTAPSGSTRSSPPATPPVDTWPAAPSRPWPRSPPTAGARSIWNRVKPTC